MTAYTPGRTYDTTQSADDSDAPFIQYSTGLPTYDAMSTYDVQRSPQSAPRYTFVLCGDGDDHLAICSSAEAPCPSHPATARIAHHEPRHAGHVQSRLGGARGHGEGQPTASSSRAALGQALAAEYGGDGGGDGYMYGVRQRAALAMSLGVG